MKKIYWSAISFSIGIILSDILVYFLSTNPDTHIFAGTIKAIICIAAFSWVNSKLEVKKEELDEARKISDQLARELKKLDKKIEFKSIKEKAIEKEMNFFSKK